MVSGPLNKRIVLIGGTLAVLLLLICALLLYAFRSPLSKHVWYEYHRHPELVMRLNPNDAKLRVDIGNYFYGGGAYDTERAKDAFQAALAVDPETAYANHQLARIYFVRGNFDLSLQYINREIALFPQNLHAYYVRGLILGFRGEPEDLDQAEEDFRHVVQNDKEEWGPYNDLAWILSVKGEYEEVIKVVELAFENNSETESNPWLLNSIGAAHLNLGNHIEAVEYLERAKAEAEKVTPEEWRLAYPGNDPKTDTGGIAAFIAAIETNLEVARNNATL